MTKSQENKFNMYLQVVNTCNEYQTEWSFLKAFGNAFDKFNIGISNIKQCRQIQELNLTGTTKERHDRTNELIEITLRHISSLKAFFLIKGDKEVYEAISYAKYELVSSRDTTLIEKCELVYNKALQQDESIADFGITKETLKEFKSKIKIVNTMLTASKAAMIKRKMATENLVAQFVACDKQLKGQLDNLMLIFKEQHPDFHRAYTISRKISHLGIRHQKEQTIEEGRQAA